ncbi:hypothetical protein ACJX0J_032798, partial [Zea mays]
FEFSFRAGKPPEFGDETNYVLYLILKNDVFFRSFVTNSIINAIYHSNVWSNIL